MLSFQYLSNNTHFYRPTTKLNQQPSQMDPIRNHRKKTFIHLQISNANALQYTNPTFRTNANSYQTTQPINSIATNRGFSATEQRKQKFLFNITKSNTQTPYIVPKNIRQYSGSPLSPSPFFLLRMNKAHRLNPSVQMTRTGLKLREVLLKNPIGIFDNIRIFCGPVQAAQTNLRVGS